MTEYKPTDKQVEAVRLIGGPAKFIQLEGGSRSGKSFIAVRVIIIRALAAAGSRHAIVRFRFNHVKSTIGMDTLPKVMSLCFPDVSYKIDKSDWVVKFPNGSEIWLIGLDDKARTEKILGFEFASIYANEASQLAYSAINMAITRLAQKCMYKVSGVERELRLKMLIDCNPPTQAHWTYKLFHRGIDPDTNQPVDRADYAYLLMNPTDNRDNLPPDYIDSLEKLPTRMRLRFLEGKYGDVTENSMWSIEMIDKWRAADILPDMQRIIVAVDPSGADDTDNAGNDAIGIVVVGLGTDGNGYVLEDLTIKAGPAAWGNVATTAYDRHSADLIVGETNYGGAMVGFVVRAAKPGVPFKTVTASRGKVVRAEPISALTEQGKIRFAGQFPDLEEELCAMTTAGYIGGKSPNRADAMIWGFTELFPGIAKVEKKRESRVYRQSQSGGGGSGWMSV